MNAVSPLGLLQHVHRRQAGDSEIEESPQSRRHLTGRGHYEMDGDTDARTTAGAGKTFISGQQLLIHRPCHICQDIAQPITVMKSLSIRDRVCADVG